MVAASLFDVHIEYIYAQVIPGLPAFSNCLQAKMEAFRNNASCPEHILANTTPHHTYIYTAEGV